MLDQRQRRLAGVVHMLYKCFGFVGYIPKQQAPVCQRQE